MTDYFKRLFSFNNWANKEVLACLIANHIEDEKIIRLMSHIAHAQGNWYKRIVNQQNDVMVWDVMSVEEMSRQLEQNGKHWLDYLNRLQESDFKRSTHYRNLQGKAFINDIQDILAHVVNHSTYHRGQIILSIRNAGYVPPVTDFIQYARLFPK
jgi:uncharacterized damage-inducible protein DinB